LKRIKNISIILVGNWNTKIFKPSWVMSELLGLQGNEELELGFDNNLQPIYKYKNLRLIPTDRAFEIRFENINNELIEIANRIVIKLITTLPFTPNLLAGFNYKLPYNCKIKDLKIPDYTNKYSLSEIKLIKIEPDYTVNVILSCGETKYVMYNFHYKDLGFIKENTIKNHINYIIKQHGN